MIPSQNEIEACAPLLAISVNASDELSGEPRKYQTKQPFNRNTIGRAVELGKQEAIDRFTRPKRCEQRSADRFCRSRPGASWQSCGGQCFLWDLPLMTRTETRRGAIDVVAEYLRRPRRREGSSCRSRRRTDARSASPKKLASSQSECTKLRKVSGSATCVSSNRNSPWPRLSCPLSIPLPLVRTVANSELASG